MEDTPKFDLGALGSFDFTPDWAKKDAGVNIGKIRPEAGDDAQRGFAERKPFDRSRPSGAARREGAGAGGGRGGLGDRRGAPRREGFGPRDRAPERERPRPLDVEVKILPDPKALGTVIRKLQSDYHAYKLKDLAYFFLNNPSSVQMRLSPRKPADGEAPAAPVTFYQCKACGYATTSSDDLVAHVMSAHLGDYYESKEIEVEPPKGNFNCVAKCGLSGVLLGPPNIHEFNETVREVIRTRYPNMSEAQYRAHIEMVRDAESIESWRQSATKKTVFVTKGAGEEAPNLTREQAENEFRRTILDSLVSTPNPLLVAADVALKSTCLPLVWAVRDVLEAERRTPREMCYALRGAFHHRRLHFFRTNEARGQEFVTSVAFKEFDAAHAIPELVRLSKFIGENPCSPLVDIVTSPEDERHLLWLASTGHVVAFTNGVYSAVEKFPKYGPQWQKRRAKASDAAPAVDAPAVPEASPVDAPSAEASVSAPEAPSVEPAVPEASAVDAPSAEASVSAPEAPSAEPAVPEASPVDAPSAEPAPEAPAAS